MVYNSAAVTTWYTPGKRLGGELDSPVFTHPMTFIVVLLIGALLVGGSILVSNALRRGRRPAQALICPACSYFNAAHAKFCAQCGQRLV